jgi:hypothetical protein
VTEPLPDYVPLTALHQCALPELLKLSPDTGETETRRPGNVWLCPQCSTRWVAVPVGLRGSGMQVVWIIQPPPLTEPAEPAAATTTAGQTTPEV